MVTATSDRATLDRARSERPSLIVMDLGDERLAPFETIRALKGDPATAGARIVGFFSHVDVEIRNRAIDAGCDVVLPRSAFVKQLPRLVENLDGDRA